MFPPGDNVAMNYPLFLLQNVKSLLVTIGFLDFVIKPKLKGENVMPRFYTEMKIKTAEEIWKEASKRSTTLMGEKRIINALYREQDDSYKWPIRNHFNVTNRAIRHGWKFERESGCVMSGLEWAYFLECEMSYIVNNSKNW
jgi:hypothetical protein